jgi:hypothetical protein
MITHQCTITETEHHEASRPAFCSYPVLVRYGPRCDTNNRCSGCITPKSDITTVLQCHAYQERIRAARVCSDADIR